MWKAAARQLKKIEAERKKVADADADADCKKLNLKVSTRWQNTHVPDVFDVQLGSPHQGPMRRARSLRLRSSQTNN